MKKVILFLFAFLSLLSLNLKNIYAEEVNGETSVEEIVIEKIYTYEDYTTVATLILRSDMTYTMSATELTYGQTIEFNGFFRVEDSLNGHIQLYMGETPFGEVCIDELTKTFDIIEDEEITEEEIVYPCQVVIIDSSYGEVLVDRFEGNVGEVVKVNPKAYAFCKLSEIYVNGVALTPNDNGVYEFLLVEGENKITSKFEISQNDMAILAENINNYEKGFFDRIFTLENIFNLISWIMTAVFSTGFLAVLLKNKKVKALTGDEISASVNGSVPVAVENAIVDKFTPVLTTIQGAIENINNCVNVLTRCTILAQENTSESRLAILDEITYIKASEKELQEQARAIINSEVLEQTRAKLEKKLAIEELEKKNQEIYNEEQKVKGRI